MGIEENYDEKTMTAYSEGYRGFMELMEIALTDMIIGVKAETTLEKAAYLSLYAPLLDRLLELGALSETKYMELSRELNKNNPRPLSVFDPEVDCRTGEEVQDGKAKLFSWDAD